MTNLPKYAGISPSGHRVRPEHAFDCLPQARKAFFMYWCFEHELIADLNSYIGSSGVRLFVARSAERGQPVGCAPTCPAMACFNFVLEIAINGHSSPVGMAHELLAQIGIDRIE